MAQPISVKVVQVCSVAPPPESTTSASPTSLPLTFFDIRWLRIPPTEYLYFYEFPNPATSSHSILERLKHSLSLTLQHFLPLVGKLTWPHDSPIPIISYAPGDAISLTVAESNVDFNHVSGANFSEAARCSSLIPRLTISPDEASLLALQFTVFPNSGFSIGITKHHAALDGKAITSVLKLWAYISSNLGESSSSMILPEQLIPFYDRTVIKSPPGITEIYLNELVKLGGRNLTVWCYEEHQVPVDAFRAKIELTHSHLEKLKQSVLLKLKEKVKVSTFSITCACVWSCLAKAKESKALKSSLIFGADCRVHLDIPLTYFGNCLARRVAVAETESLLGDDGFFKALEAISLALNRLEDGLLDGAETWLTFPFEDEVFVVAGSPRFKNYDTDFGWGRPKKVEMSSLCRTDKVATFFLSDSKNPSGGVEVELALKKHELEHFTSLLAKVLESL